MTSTAWFHCFSGIAGDMALGALIDAGAPADDVRAMLELLPIDGWRLETEATQRCGLAATLAIVEVADGTAERTFADIRRLLTAAGLPARVHQRALATFTRLAEVEGAIHRQLPDDVHFHEVGGLDAIVDVVGVCAALELLGVDDVQASPVAQGVGTVRAEHGVLPNPAPAVVALLRGAPVYGLDIAMELTTPTGAALLNAIGTRFGPMPAMTVDAIGYGAGTRELPSRPNVVQVVIGAAAATTTSDGVPAVELAANVDDATGEVLAHAIAALLAAGAHDAWVTPIVMKKGRPAHTVHALCDPPTVAAITQVLITETGTLGVRGTLVERWPQARQDSAVEVEGHTVRIKRSAGRVKVEHDDAVVAAAALGLPLREVLSRAEAQGWAK